ncbi:MULTISPECIES: hypothetical protein [Gordonia]|uniref:hypothetical protein n=1 Tax=Gordonia TaxID=2053 RepID=UPI0011469AA3|nr:MULTISPECIES: hypothetical protein [Gordonia]NKY92751.1 hypothetical protein [Gordonia sputi]
MLRDAADEAKGSTTTPPDAAGNLSGHHGRQTQVAERGKGVLPRIEVAGCRRVYPAGVRPRVGVGAATFGAPQRLQPFGRFASAS